MSYESRTTATATEREILDLVEQHLPPEALSALAEKLHSLVGMIRDTDDNGGFGPRAGSPPPWRANDSVLAMDASPSSPRGQAALRLATQLCRGIIGEDACLAADSAESVMRQTLIALGHDGGRLVHSSALPLLLKAALRQRAQGASDSASPIGAMRPIAGGDAGFARRFPAAAAVRRI